MSFNTVVLMAHDTDLEQRFAACAAQEGIDQPANWARQYLWPLCGKDTAAIDAYQYAIDGDKDRIGNYGKRSDVINDAKVLSIVQALKAELDAEAAAAAPA